NGIVSGCPSGNPLAGRAAFTGASSGWVGETVNLLPYRGRSVLVRFRLGTDQTGGAAGWWIDDITVSFTQSSCFSPTPAITPTGTINTPTSTASFTNSPTNTP